MPASIYRSDTTCPEVDTNSSNLHDRLKANSNSKWNLIWRGGVEVPHHPPSFCIHRKLLQLDSRCPQHFQIVVCQAQLLASSQTVASKRRLYRSLSLEVARFGRLCNSYSQMPLGVTVEVEATWIICSAGLLISKQGDKSVSTWINSLISDPKPTLSETNMSFIITVSKVKSIRWRMQLRPNHYDEEIEQLHYAIAITTWTWETWHTGGSKIVTYFSFMC